ncbi:MAG: ubiquinol-cytochrome c reductase iron-sulfur subunit [Candidatus Aminicenantales bacterium]|jgi:Rieske Fe-S protein
MRLQHSLFTRRVFLNSLLGGSLTAFAAIFIGPLVKFVFPPYKEPDEVKLAAADYSGLPANEVKGFAWGNKPGLIKRAADGSLVAFVAVCSHLDCNVTYLPAERKFYCACHKGWYDENGTNIAGPPPSPLRRLAVSLDGESLVVKKQG